MESVLKMRSPRRRGVLPAEAPEASSEKESVSYLSMDAVLLISRLGGNRVAALRI